MSVSRGTLAAWRAAGSLQYLAHFLGKTPKQVVRYWDRGWIPGAYRGVGRTGGEVEATPVRAAPSLPLHRRPKRLEASPTSQGNPGGSHRRVRYTDQTVAIVAQRVGIAREAALRRRYRTRSRTTGGVLWEATLAREAILGFQRLNLEDVSQEQRILNLLPIEELIEAKSPGEFRARAMLAYREIRRRLVPRAKSQEPSVTCHPPDSVATWLLAPGSWHSADAALLDRVLLPLLSKPTLGEFLTAYEEAIDQLTWRDVERDSKLGQAAAEIAVTKPIAAMFTAAAVAIAKSGRRPSVASVARELSISRQGLYRLCARLRCREDLDRAIALGAA